MNLVFNFISEPPSWYSHYLQQIQHPISLYYDYKRRVHTCYTKQSEKDSLIADNQLPVSIFSFHDSGFH